MARVTKTQKLEAVLATLMATEGTEAQVAFIEAEIALLAKRAGAERKPTKGQKENVKTKVDIVLFLEGTEAGACATDVGVAVGVSVQKASQLLKQLVEANHVTRTEGTGKVKTNFTV